MKTGLCFGLTRAFQSTESIKWSGGRLINLDVEKYRFPSYLDGVPVNEISLIGTLLIGLQKSGFSWYNFQTEGRREKLMQNSKPESIKAELIKAELWFLEFRMHQNVPFQKDKGLKTENS